MDGKGSFYVYLIMAFSVLLAGHQLIHQTVPFVTVLQLVAGVDKYDLLPQFGAGTQ